MPISKDADYSFYLYTCNRCRGCTTDKSGKELPICPSFEHFGFFAYSGGGKGYAAQGVLEGQVEPSEGLAHVAMNCLLCGACAAMCPPGFEITAFIRDLRDHAAQEGFFVSKKHERMLKNMHKKGNPWGLDNSARPTPEQVGASHAEQSEILLFLGCHAGLDKSSPDNALKILKAAGIPFAMLDDEPCCGAPALELGDAALFAEIAERNIEALNESGAERIVTLCPHCASTFTNDYFEHGDLEVEVTHISEYLVEVIGEGRINLKEEGPEKTAVFHDPCHLGRGLERCLEPRAVLEAVPGVSTVEMKRNREAAFCCGAGGLSAELVPELSKATAKARLEEVKDSGAELIATACPYCKSWLSRQAGDEFEVQDLVDMVAEALK